MSWNVNGVRSAAGKGLLQWMKASESDVICLQETKANLDQVGFDVHSAHGYRSEWMSALKPGYSGVATWFRGEPDEVRRGIGGEEFDDEGRVLSIRFGGVWVVNAYFPNSQREGARLPYKLRFCARMEQHLSDLRKGGAHVVLCGDYNIAHQAIDLRNPKQNENNAGYLPEERAWMTRFLGLGFVDAFRRAEPGGGHYTWWSYRPGVRAKNIGWRIDYHCVDQGLAERVRRAWIEPDVTGSDHCPIGIELVD